MNLYISASNRKCNSYDLLKSLKKEDDILLSLADLNIKYCGGCNACAKNETNSCILKDGMTEIYKAIEKCNR